MIDLKQFEIPVEHFIRSYQNVSFSSDRLGSVAYDQYNSALNFALEKIGENEVFSKYAKGLKFRYESWLAAQSRCVSSVIAGPANFNVAKAEKANAMAYKRLNEIISYKEYGLKRALKTFEVKISFKEQKQNELSYALEDLRLENFLNDYLKKDNQNLTKELITIDLIAAGFNKNLIDDASWRVNEICNGRKINVSLAKKKIKHIEKQLKDIEEMDAINFDFSNTNITFVNDKENNRFKLIFNEKPSIETIQQLKKMAFKYAPSSGAWQAIRTNASAYKIQNFFN